MSEGMTCREVRDELLDYQRGRVDPEARARIAAHLEGCEACRRAAAVEAELSAQLERRLPRHAAPIALQRRLAAQLREAPDAATARRGEASDSATPRRRARLGRYLAPVASALAAAALVLVAVRLAPSRGADELTDEAVNDHLRVVQSTHPVEIESGGIHQVKPWFTGRLDFAPRVAFSGDDEFPLTGGSVGWFRDRKAAVLVFKRRLHTISLLVMRSDGLPWPPPSRDLGRLKVAARDARGFSVLLWRDGDLGYALVSDVSRADLELLATRLNP